ncbi:MAG TPA: hypothetical protein EYP35_09500 [Desulfobacterales bacterium]|nr:hypothetical protein [Desulfobacterales bacterium]HIP38461.1 hypothetical protein [Desulfocapsa sulfexigens]
MKNILSKLSLKKIFSLFTVITIALLFVVIFLAAKQYFLYTHCEKLVDTSQQILFQFTGIKEHINETLLSKKKLNSSALIKEIQGLDIDLKKILDDILIPEEFKLSFISQVDLVNVTVSLRSIQNNEKMLTAEQLGTFSAQLRRINSKLNGFHQLISRYTQTQLLGLHQAFVGLLTIMIALVSIMLLVINRYITTPILHYCRALFPKETDSISLFTLHETIETLASQPLEQKNKTGNNKKDTKELSRLYRYSSIGHLLGGLSHELTNISNGAINYTQAILDLGNDLHLDDDSRQLLHKLFTEEKKMSQLLSRMVHFTSGSANATAKILSLDDIFDEIKTLVRGTFKNDGIELAVSLCDPAFTLNHHVSDLQLVILSALQSSRVSLNTRFQKSQSGVKQIEIILDDESLLHNTVCVSIRDNGAPKNTNIMNSGDHAGRPWHNMTFCVDFLQTFGGTLSISREKDQTNLCVITIPLHA